MFCCITLRYSSSFIFCRTKSLFISPTGAPNILDIIREVSDDYLKAADVLTINSDKIILQKQVAKLSEKSKNNEYIIRGKLVEKDYQIKNLSEKFNSMQSMSEKAITATTQVQNPRQFSSIAQTLFTSGVLNVEEKIKEG
jgi:hypothetical protein